jgi:superfamily I DNA/RNA helicase
LKSFLFRVEEKRASDLACASKPNKGVPPATFQLVVNYRSHGGIINAAHSVITLLTTFWEHSIDVLARETGVVDGSKPVFFRGYENDDVRYEQFLFCESGSHIEFGAQQVILVRNDQARDKLRQQVGDIGMILTLYESKGLEFNDVLLYNFFEDSSADLTCWRVVLNGIERSPRSDLTELAPAFDEIKHAKICTELKFLYVAITRARKNM